MPVSGLVITIADAPGAGRDLRAALAGDERIEIGPPAGRKLPVVADTRDADEDRRLWRRLNDMPEVAHVDVVFVHFDDVAAGEETGDER